jgi:hypothetical protein
MWGFVGGVVMEQPAGPIATCAKRQTRKIIRIKSERATMTSQIENYCCEEHNEARVEAGRQATAAGRPPMSTSEEVAAQAAVETHLAGRANRRN